MAEAFLALMQLIQLRDCYRQEWKPIWEKNENNYCIYQSKEAYPHPTNGGKFRLFVDKGNSNWWILD